MFPALAGGRTIPFGAGRNRGHGREGDAEFRRERLREEPWHRRQHFRAGAETAKAFHCRRPQTPCGRREVANPRKIDLAGCVNTPFSESRKACAGSCRILVGWARSFRLLLAPCAGTLGRGANRQPRSPDRRSETPQPPRIAFRGTSPIRICAHLFAVPSAQLLHLLRRPDAKLRPPRPSICGANRRPQRWPAASDWKSWLACGPTIGKS